MKIVITDSGLGGLSVATGLFEILKTGKYPGDTKLLYVNALPETGRGYNTIPDTGQKVRLFDNVLHGITRRFDPDIVAIACNTLSVIVNKTDYYREHSGRITGIVESGINSFINDMGKNKNCHIIVFGAETTIEIGAHRTLLIENGIPGANIITQSCPGLASAIEKDYRSDETRQLVDEYVKAALEPMVSKNHIIYAYLACTHYGYIKHEFARSLRHAEFLQFGIFNPNSSMVNSLREKINPASDSRQLKAAQVEIQIYSRCVILPEEIVSISELVKDHSPATARALQNYKIEPDLFIPI
jgi:glutamate racemase